MDGGEHCLLIGSDTVVVLDGKILEKPLDEEHAVAMLKSLSDRSHSVVSGVALILGGERRVFYEETKVSFRGMGDSEIAAYVSTGEPMDKAGGYGIQGAGGAFVTGISGDYYAVMGVFFAIGGMVARHESWFLQCILL